MATYYYGTVNEEGKKLGGSGGWECRPTSEAGCFLIKFDKKFEGIPTVVVSQVWPGDIKSKGGNTRDNALVVGCDANEAKIKTGSHTGVGEHRKFSFIAAGELAT